MGGNLQEVIQSIFFCYSTEKTNSLIIRLYYQLSLQRLLACPVTVYSLLHIADGIEACGPVWTYWAFPMERFCGILQPWIKSRRFPFANLDNHVVAMAQILHIKIRYSLHEKLSWKPSSQGSQKGFCATNCEYNGLVIVCVIASLLKVLVLQILHAYFFTLMWLIPKSTTAYSRRSSSVWRHDTIQVWGLCGDTYLSKTLKNGGRFR